MFIRRKDFRPMLAAEGTEEMLKRKLSEGYPLLCTPKLDGIRCIQTPDGLRSRSLKPIRSSYAQRLFSYPEFHGVDGELIDGPPNAPLVMNRTTSTVMSYDGASPELKFYLFDYCGADSPGMYYSMRLRALAEQAKDVWDKHGQEALKYVIMVQHSVSTLEELLQYEENCVKVGYEGIVVRDPSGPYKFGRSTQVQGWMLKVKRFADSEAIIEGFEPLMQNQNEAVIDNLGLQKRGSSIAGKVAQHTLGNFLVRDPTKNWTFSVGSGLDMAFRQEVWNNREKYLGQTLTYKYMPHGSINAPRHPIYKGIRHPDDQG